MWLIWTVYTNGSSHFVLRNGSVQLTISNGRITSLVDVKLKYVFQIFFFALQMLKLIIFFQAGSSSQRVRLVVWLSSKIDLTTGMHGVCIAIIWLCGWIDA